MSTDYNYISCSNNVWGIGEGGPNPQPTTVAAVIVPLSPDNPTQYASILKLCDNSSLNLQNLQVGQGSECSVDINNHATVTLNGSFGVSQNGVGNQIFSIKGDSIANIGGTLKGAGNRIGADILIDNWSDQSYTGSAVNLTKLVHETGRKINVVYRFGASDLVALDNINKLYFQSFKLTAYWWFKWTVRKIMGIKVGVSGPSWL